MKPILIHRPRLILPRVSVIALALSLPLTGELDGAEPTPVRGLLEVRHEKVALRGGFWGPRLKVHHEVTIPHALDELEKDGHVTNFDKAAGKFDGPLKGHHAFDSDLYKALEGGLYSLRHMPDDSLRKRVDGILDRIIAAQQKDGFLISFFIVNGLEKRWDHLRREHQMYNAGHFFEAAVEHARLTGERKVLESAERFADHIDGIFGEGKRYDVDGHQEVELALIKLYRATGKVRYLNLARFFLDERGYLHGMERKPFDPSKVPEPPPPDPSLSPAEQRRAKFHATLEKRNGRMQDHKPVVDQKEAIGHAVRAAYMYAAMTDVLRFMDAPGFEAALDSIWNDVVSRKMYITGGIGTAQYGDEGFGDPYLLPNGSAYCESCAAIAHVLWEHRMNLLNGHAGYADLMELTIYNGMLSGISLSGDKFFYQNPLSAEKGHERKPWIGLSCCPTNLARIIPQIGGLVYATGKGAVFVNLYAAGEASIKLGDGTNLKIDQKTEYPWNGSVRITITPEKESEFDLGLRIPGWARGRPVPSDLYAPAGPGTPPVSIKINGQPADASPQQDGYAHLKRAWKAGDTVELDLPMPVQRVVAHEQLKDARGKVALMRGPIVYCIEAIDHPDVDLFRLTLPRDTGLQAEHRADLLGGVTVLRGKALADGERPVALTAIPSYAWSNRKKGAMTVWINESLQK